MSQIYDTVKEMELHNEQKKNNRAKPRPMKTFGKIVRQRHYNMHKDYIADASRRFREITTNVLNRGACR